MAYTVERVGLVASLLLSTGLLAEVLRAKLVDEPNRATKADIETVVAQATSDVEDTNSRVKTLEDNVASVDQRAAKAISDIEEVDSKVQTLGTIASYNTQQQYDLRLALLEEGFDDMVMQTNAAFSLILAGDCEMENRVNAGIIPPKSLQECFQERVEWLNKFQQRSSIIK